MKTKSKPVPPPQRRPAMVDGVLVVCANTAAAAHALRVERSELFALRDKGLPGFSPSGRVYMLEVLAGLDKRAFDDNLSDRESDNANWWRLRFWGWMDREGLPGVPKAWQGKGELFKKRVYYVHV